MDLSLRIFTIVLIVVVVSILEAKFYEIGPVIWIKRSLRRKYALEGKDRNELLSRVQELLPQVNDSNTVFSLHKTTSHHSGGSVQVATNTYDLHVFVVDNDSFWVIPMEYSRWKKSYQLGRPGKFSTDSVKDVSLTGKHGKHLIFTFLLEINGQQITINMDLVPFCFRKNSFYPFDLMQEIACENAFQTAEKMARIACDITPEELEESRLKDECLKYGTYAGCAGAIGILSAPSVSIIPSIVCFVIAFLFLGMMVLKNQPPKFSALVVLIELAIAYLLLK